MISQSAVQDCSSAGPSVGPSFDFKQSQLLTVPFKSAQTLVKMILPQRVERFRLQPHAQKMLDRFLSYSKLDSPLIVWMGLHSC